VTTALEGALLLGQGRYADAAARFRAAHAITGGPFWLPEIGLTLDRAGHTDSALAIYQRYLDSSHNYRLYPDAARLAPVLKRAAELYEAKGDRARALERYRQLAELWRGADAKLGPEVAEVRRRMGELAGEGR
jgi:tetratricopeptide (TPR) repeat protein